MGPLLILGLVAGALRLAGVAGVAPLQGWSPAIRGGLAAMLVVTASAHFGRRRSDLIAMVPPQLPRPDLLVKLTGLAEFAAAAGLAVGMTAHWAAMGLVALFLIVFPANVHAARRGIGIGGRPPTPLLPRTLMQALFVATAVLVAI